MGIGGAVCNIGVTKILGTVVQTMPAFHKAAVSATARTYAFGSLKTHEDWQRVLGFALRAEVNHVDTCHATTVGNNIYIIRSVGCKAGERGRVGIFHTGDTRIKRESLRTVFDGPRGGTTDLGPADVGRSGGDVAHRYGFDTRTIRSLLDFEVVQIGSPRGT